MSRSTNAERTASGKFGLLARQSRGPALPATTMYRPSGVFVGPSRMSARWLPLTSDVEKDHNRYGCKRDPDGRLANNLTQATSITFSSA